MIVRFSVLIVAQGLVTENEYTHIRQMSKDF